MFWSLKQFQFKQVRNNEPYLIVLKPFEQFSCRLFEFFIEVASNNRSVYIDSLYHLYLVCNSTWPQQPCISNYYPNLVRNMHQLNAY